MSAELLYAVEDEEVVLGAALLYPDAVETMLATLEPGDFGKPSHGAIFQAVADLYHEGAAVNVLTVRARLRRNGSDWDSAAGDLVALQSNSLGPKSVPTHARAVASFALRRRVCAEATALQAAVTDITKDPAELLDAHRANLAAIDSPALCSPPGDVDVTAFIAEQEEPTAVVVPGDLAEDDRVVIVAPEGVGKSELVRQLLMGSASGLHPLTFRPMPAVPALLVDLENPRQLVRDRLRYLADLAGRTNPENRAPCTLWHKPGGIDLRKRADRLAFEDVLRRKRPKLVALGPVYKSYARRASESDEQVAGEVQAILDDLRTRFRFALVLEHHAPQASNGVRDLRPFGSSLWLRWPEYGLSLKPDPKRPQVLIVGRWRGDRSQAEWPDELHRGAVWPWEGKWNRGVPSFESHEEVEENDPVF